MGYIVMSAPLRKEAPEWFAPLSYGKDGEIAPDQLLRRGGRATMFETPAAANAAIRATLAKAVDRAREPDATLTGPHEGPGAASSRTVPLDAVVGPQREG